MTQTLERLADAATNARGGADLFRYGVATRIPDAAFAAAGPDGSVLVRGIDLCKAGTFNGLDLLDEDLVAMAARFADLSYVRACSCPRSGSTIRGRCCRSSGTSRPSTPTFASTTPTGSRARSSAATSGSPAPSTTTPPRS